MPQGLQQPWELKFFFCTFKMITEAILEKHRMVIHWIKDPTMTNRSAWIVPRWKQRQCLVVQVHEAGEVHGELKQNREDCISIEDVWQRPLRGENFQRLRKEEGADNNRVSRMNATVIVTTLMTMLLAGNTSLIIPSPRIDTIPLLHRWQTQHGSSTQSPTSVPMNPLLTPIHLTCKVTIFLFLDLSIYTPACLRPFLPRPPNLQNVTILSSTTLLFHEPTFCVLFFFFFKILIT